MEAGVDAANRQEQLETAANRQAGVDAANREAGVDAANRQEQLETAANRQAGVDAANREAGVDAANRQEELETAANRQAGVDAANREAGTKEEQSVKQADQAESELSFFGEAGEAGVGVLYIRDWSDLTPQGQAQVLFWLSEADQQYGGGIAGPRQTVSSSQRKAGNQVARAGRRGLESDSSSASGHTPDMAGGGDPMSPQIDLPHEVNRSIGGQWRRYQPGFQFTGLSAYDAATGHWLYLSPALEHEPPPVPPGEPVRGMASQPAQKAQQESAQESTAQESAAQEAAQQVSVVRMEAQRGEGSRMQEPKLDGPRQETQQKSEEVQQRVADQFQQQESEEALRRLAALPEAEQRQIAQQVAEGVRQREAERQEARQASQSLEEQQETERQEAAQREAEQVQQQVEWHQIEEHKAEEAVQRHEAALAALSAGERQRIEKQEAEQFAQDSRGRMLAQQETGQHDAPRQGPQRAEQAQRDAASAVPEDVEEERARLSAAGDLVRALWQTSQASAQERASEQREASGPPVAGDDHGAAGEQSADVQDRIDALASMSPDNVVGAIREWDGEPGLPSLPRPRRVAATGEFRQAREDFRADRDEFAGELGVPEYGQVHHAIELQVLARYPGAYTPGELNNLSNMRGINRELTDDELRQVEPTLPELRQGQASSAGDLPDGGTAVLRRPGWDPHAVAQCGHS